MGLLPLVMASTFSRRTVLITDSNTSLGLRAAREILEFSAAHVILAVCDIPVEDIARGQLQLKMAEAWTCLSWSGYHGFHTLDENVVDSFGIVVPMP